MSNIMDIIADKERKMLELTYDCKMTITRKNEKSKVDGRTKYISKTIYKDKACSVTRESNSQNRQTESENVINYNEILFCSPELEILQGDTIKVTDRSFKTVTYKAGVSNWFISHQEVILEREDRA